jgi:hypothetical protein
MLPRRRHPDLETLQEVADGVVAADGLRGRVERHLERCGECRHAVGMRQDARKGLENIARLRARLGG